jgi:hypothetical protein
MHRHSCHCPLGFDIGRGWSELAKIILASIVVIVFVLVVLIVLVAWFVTRRVRRPRAA